jgi:hypothetical protein
MSSAHLRSIKDLQRGRKPGDDTADENPACDTSGSSPCNGGLTVDGDVASDADVGVRSKLKALGEADKALIQRLQEHLGAQRIQLEERQAALTSVQRTFEKLSEVSVLFQSRKCAATTHGQIGSQGCLSSPQAKLPPLSSRRWPPPTTASSRRFEKHTSAVQRS